MKPWNNNRPTLNTEIKGGDTSLLFKDHREFFEVYFSLRSNSIMLLTKSKGNKSQSKELIDTLQAFIDWTSNYISILDDSKDSFNNIILGIDSLFSKACIKLQKENSYYDGLEIMREIIRMLNKEHEKFELLPKPMIEKERQREEWEKIQNEADKNIVKGALDFIKD